MYIVYTLYGSKSFVTVSYYIIFPMEPQVDLVIGAHVHNTFASFPVYNGTIQDPLSAPVYVGIGNGGAQLDLVGNSTNTPIWVQYQASEHGFTTLHADSSMITFSFFSDDVSNRTARYTLSIPRKTNL